MNPFLLFKQMKIAESRVFTESKSAAHYTRLTLEEVVHLICQEEKIEMPYVPGGKLNADQIKFIDTISST